MLFEGEARGLHLEVASRGHISRLHLDVASRGYISPGIPLWTRWSDIRVKCAARTERTSPRPRARSIARHWSVLIENLIHA